MINTHDNTQLCYDACMCAEIHNRIFTLMPMTEIAPNFEHPTINKSVDKLLNDLDYSNNIVKIGEFIYKNEN